VTLPRLHVVTNDDILATPGFADRARPLLEALGSDLALHLRGPAVPVRRLLEAAQALAPVAGETGSLLMVNDRADVALAAGAAGVQLGERSIPVQAARSILGPEAVIGCSTHGASEAVSALGNGADFVLLGTIWATPSHPDVEGTGLEPVRTAVAAAGEGAATGAAPILAIGGVTPARAAEAVAVGAWGVAVIRGVWQAENPSRAAAEYVQAMKAE
jgi:thiamine-phosphate pyrophosphorylase